jgi:Na+-driven multidrug efflux pump
MCLTFLAFSQPLQAVSVVLASALRGAGDTRATLVYTSVSVWFVRVGFGYLMGIVFGLGFFGVWLGWIADFTTRAILVFLRFRSGRWKALRI